MARDEIFMAGGCACEGSSGGSRDRGESVGANPKCENATQCRHTNRLNRNDISYMHALLNSLKCCHYIE